MFIIISYIVYYSVLTTVFSEWVEISQQHYKKPMKPTHNHPIIATISNHEDKPKGNRIYFNHSLENHIRDKTPAHVWPNEPNLDDSNVFHVKNVMHDQGYGITSNKGQDNKGEISIIRKVKPNQDENRRRTTASHNNGAMIGPKDHSRKQFLDDREDQIEVINVSNIEHDISEFNAPNEEFEHNKTVRRKNIARTTHIPNVRNKNNHPQKIFKTDRPDRDNTGQRHKTNFNSDNNKQPINFKNNMRRVQIVDGKPKGHYDLSTENTRLSMTVKPAFKRNDVGNPETTISMSSNKEQTNRVQINNLNDNKLNPNPEINRYTSIELNEEYNGKTTVNENVVPSHKTTVRYHSTTDRIYKKNKPENNGFDNSELIDSHNRNPDDVMIEEITSDLKDFKIHKIAGIGTVKRVSPTEVVKLKRRNEAVKPITEHPADEGIEIEEEEYNNSYKKLQFKNIESTTTSSAPVLNSNKYKPNVNSGINIPETDGGINPYKVVRPSEEPLPEFVTKQEHFEEMPSIDANEFTKEPNLNSEKYFEKKTEKPEEFENQDDLNQKNHEDPVSNESKTNAMENLIRFLKTVTDIITRNTKRGVQGKMRYLEDLRDAILANIEERIEAAFPDDVVGPKRRSRAAQKARGHVEFPSSESALMTISFLTFAVFLIKLVLQVIQAYKNKTMMVVPTVVAAVGRAYNNRNNGN